VPYWWWLSVFIQVCRGVVHALCGNHKPENHILVKQIKFNHTRTIFIAKVALSVSLIKLMFQVFPQPCSGF
jgi:ABC-type sugar transport system permease subunit